MTDKTLFEDLKIIRRMQLEGNENIYQKIGQFQLKYHIFPKNYQNDIELSQLGKNHPELSGLISIILVYNYTEFA